GDGPFVPAKHFAAGVNASLALMNRKICRTIDSTLLGKPGQFAASPVEGEDRDPLPPRAVKIGSVARDAADDHKRSLAHASASSCVIDHAPPKGRATTR